MTITLVATDEEISHKLQLDIHKTERMKQYLYRSAIVHFCQSITKRHDPEFLIRPDPPESKLENLDATSPEGRPDPSTTLLFFARQVTN